MYVTTLISFVEKWGIKKRAESAFAIPVHLWLLSTQSLNAEFPIIEYSLLKLAFNRNVGLCFIYDTNKCN